MNRDEPAYIKTRSVGLLAKKIERAYKALAHCELCPRKCGVNRLAGEYGFCNTGERAVVSSFNAHFGEETPLVGNHGSGTIFFTHCNLLCLFCQNFEISHFGHGNPVSCDRLAEMMMSLQNSGCLNINFVTPSHVVPQMLSALDIAIDKGLKIPLVFNSGGYDSVPTLKMLDGIVDIYMPDMKFMNPDTAERLCQTRDYPMILRKAVLEMHRQVGDLIIDDTGLARRGLLVRHLVLPEGLADTHKIMTFIANKVSVDTYVNIMPQYRPCGRAHEIRGLNRSLSNKEYVTSLKQAEDAGIRRLDQRRRAFIIR
ncbi:MAG: radical SAM protein [Desulfobacteraceae bacterium]|nr:radical SAM protein [Desulfobacteraceae bacterium]